MYFDQSEFDIKFEWGIKGSEILSSVSDSIIIVDTMSFSTAVTVAVSRGAIVYPYKWNYTSKVKFSKSVNAILAGPRGKGKYSLSPLSLKELNMGDRIVLPSPNGSSISLSTGDTPTFAGCFRNARDVAKAASKIGSRISVIACGERWNSDNSLRPSIEDLLGAGAILSHLEGIFSPEAEITKNIFDNNKNKLDYFLEKSSSGKELIERGYTADIQIIKEMNVDKIAPILIEGAYRDRE